MLHQKDLEIVRSLRNGDARDFDGFFDEIFPRLYRFVLQRVGGDAEAARDLCQQTLVRAMEHLDGYRGEAALFSWLCQIARNAISDHWERVSRDRQRVVPFEDDEGVRAEVDALAAPVALQPDQRGADAQLATLVVTALDSLPAHYSRVLEWKYVDGLSVQDMSRRLGHPFPATQSLLWRARENFREVFTRLAGRDAAALLHD
ncbi:MAG: sigma-70 family RNA polymerase sigma factor [Steroidobacteraceae bacterium]